MTYKILLNKENIAKIDNKPGRYRIFDRTGHLIYVGTSKILKHRLQSYYQEDDFSVNRTKRALRPHIHSFTYQYMPIMQARKAEKRIKEHKKPRFNFK